MPAVRGHSRVAAISVARAAAAALLFAAVAGCRAGQADTEGQAASTASTGPAPVATTSGSPTAASTAITSTSASTTATPSSITSSPAATFPTSAAEAGVTHTHFAATWQVTDAGKTTSITDARDGSSYSITATLGGTPAAFRVRGGHFQSCDVRSCMVKELDATAAANLTFNLASIYLDPKAGMQVFVGSAQAYPAAGWNGHPVACASGPNTTFGGTGRVCYLTDVDLLLSLDNNGQHSQLSSLSGDVPSSLFTDLTGPLSQP